MPDVVVAVKRPGTRLKGMLSRYLMQIESNIWTGTLSGTVYNAMVELIDDKNAVVITFNKKARGLTLVRSGEYLSKFKMLDGILLAYTKNNEK